MKRTGEKKPYDSRRDAESAEESTKQGGNKGTEVIADFELRNADWENRCTKKKTQGAGDGWLQHERLGYNYRLSDINCALGIAQLKRIDEILEKRDRVAQLYNERLSKGEGVQGSRGAEAIAECGLGRPMDKEEEAERT